MAVDPVCKMNVDEASAQYKSNYNGSTYYFCMVGCKVAFDENPQKYLGGGQPTGCGCGHSHGH
jgi:YHS domain-containing protein